MKSKYIPLFFLSCFVTLMIYEVGSYEISRHMHAQVVQPVPPQLPILTQIGPPAGPCDATNTPQLDINGDPNPTAIGRFYQCNNNTGPYGWMSLPAPSNLYLNGVLQAAPKCAFYTGTTAANGTITFNISSLGLTSLVGQPQPSVTGTGTSPATVNLTAASTTSISLFVTSGTILSVVGINVSLFGAAALPVGVYFCGV